MQQRQDYLESQIGIISRMLRKLLEKLLNIKSDDSNDTELEAIMFSPISSDKEGLVIDTIQGIEEAKLIDTLTSEYGYDNDSLKLLADILYQLSIKLTYGLDFRKKALILYKHYLTHAQKNIDFVVYKRVHELETGS